MKKIYTHFSFLNFISMPKIEERQYKTLFTTLTNLMKKNYASFILACLLIFSGNAFGQFSIATSSTNYTQNFNSLASTGTAIAWTNNTTLTGWYAKTTATASITSYNPNTGATTTAGLYSFGVLGTNPITERSLGFAPSNGYTGTAGTGKGFLGWRLKNNTGAAISAIVINWTGEQWRKDNTVNQSIVLSYQTSTTAITDLTADTWTTTSSTFTSPIITTGAAALDGNASANRTSGISITISVSLAAGDEIMLRWEDLNDSGNDHFLTIDDVTINATPACTAQTITAISPSTITKTYGDAIYSVATTASSTLTVTYASSATGVATVDASGDVTIVGPGTATITASQAGNGTYCAAANVTQALTVNPKNLTISGLTANNKTFDGTTTATLSGTPTLVGIVGSDAVTVSGSPAANFSDALVGTGKTVTVTGYTLSGADAGKYTLSQPTGLTADITAASNAIDLNPTTQAKGPYCNATSNSIALTYTITGTVTAPFIQLSNTSGSFASGTTNLGGTVTGSGTLTITGTIPASQTASTVYRVRIVSTDVTPVISLDNNSNITVTAATTPSVSIASITTGTESNLCRFICNLYSHTY
jgi:hypothetical protein